LSNLIHFDVIFNFTPLTSVAACDQMLSVAGNEKAGLITRKMIVERRIAANQDTSELEARLARYNVRIQNTEAMIAQGPDEEELLELQLELADFIRGRARVSRRLNSLGEYFEVTRQTDTGELDVRIAFWDDYIAQLEAYKATLPPDQEASAA
jgi:hypothetical protein